MAHDFSYTNTVINASGPIKPTTKNAPSDPREVVTNYSDIANIPNPYVGLVVRVLTDETNSNKMTDYIVTSLKANNLGVANTLVNTVQKYSEYLGVSSSGGGTGAGLTTEQAQQLQTAYEHSQSDHVSMEEVNEVIANAQLGCGEVDLSPYATKSYVDSKVLEVSTGGSLPDCFITITGGI